MMLKTALVKSGNINFMLGIFSGFRWYFNTKEENTSKSLPTKGVFLTELKVELNFMNYDSKSIS